MIKVLNNYPQSVSVSATSIREARAWAKKKGYDETSVEFIRLGKRNRMRLFGTARLIYVMSKR